MTNMHIMGVVMLAAMEAMGASIQGDPEYLAPDKEVTANRFATLYPKEIRTVAIVTPASVPGKESVMRCVKLMENAGLKVKVGAHVFEAAETGKKSAPVEHRIEDFRKAWNDPEVDLIVCSRGGSGTLELLDRLDWNEMRRRPELRVIGYSDVTLLLCAMLHEQAGHPMAGPMAGSMQGITAASMKEMSDVFNGRETKPVQVKSLRGGDCRGKALAGHLERLNVIAHSKYCPDTTGRIIFIECVRRNLDILRPLLDGLRDKGFFDKAAGVVFCHFTNCDEAEKIQAWLEEFAASSKIPVYCGFPFGHEKAIYTIDFNQTAVIENNTVRFVP